ncbi:MAG: NTP transferase domain-containing protein [Candidatus Sericytochromatia bacterium]|nr:NTP transferase domain-containing protein [Candidatus Sericytochromatia bacterium]
MSESPRRAVILAGGKGSRLYPYTTVFPKPLMPLQEKPILEIVLHQLKHAGVAHVTLAVGYLAELIQAYFGKGERLGITIDYSRESEPLGTAGPLRLIEELESDFLVMNGDILCTLDYADMFRFHQNHGQLATVGTYRKEVRIDLGVLELDTADQIMDYIEKPVLYYQVSMGVYCFRPEVLQYIPAGQRFDLPDLIKQLIEKEQVPQAYRFQGQWLDIGRHEDYAEAQQIFQAHSEVFLP